MRTPIDFLVVIAASFLIAGIFEALSSPDVQETVSVLHMITLSVLLFCWCRAHVSFSGIREPKGSALLCGFVSIIGVPLYFFRAFGAKKGMIKTLYSLLFTVACGGIYLLFFEAVTSFVV